MHRNPAPPAAPEAASDDLALVHATKDGDIAAFEQLVKRYDRKLLRIAQHLTRNREDAEDVVQEAFLKSFQHLGQFREDAKFSTWLIRITVNQALMKLRERRQANEMSIDEDFQSEEGNFSIEVADWAPNPEQLYKAAELREILHKTLQELRPGLRAVFVLRDIEELSLEQTAQALDLSLAAVKSRSFRARMQLRNLLSEYFRKAGEFAGAGPRPSPAELRALGLCQRAEGDSGI